jgi:hypothetical protein
MPTVSARSEHSLELQLPLGLLSSYLFFLLRRPISGSNSHYLARRIQGLKSLAPALATSNSRQIREIAEKLDSLRPANFSTVARDLQARLLLSYKPDPMPPDYVASTRAPGASLFSNVTRILLALCPAIGIGDEIIFFPVPASIKATLEKVHITVMSAYQGLWDQVKDVDSRIYYSAHRELLEVLQSANRNEQMAPDLIIFGDFEKPGLASLVCREPGTRRYVEISLGAQYAAVVDNNAGCLRSVTLMPEAQISYYAALDRLLEWLGIDRHKIQRYRDVVQSAPPAFSDTFRIFVSPFTSKYNPSLIYWTRVLSSLWDRSSSLPVEIVIDPGTTSATGRFSAALVNSARAHAAPGTRFSLACQSRGGLPLAGVFAEMERSHAVLCADSFAAHAAPLFGCTTLVVAAPGLENWRTPWSRSYYFDITRPVDEMVAAMREVLGYSDENLVQSSPTEVAPALAQDAFRLEQATDGMTALLDKGTAGHSELTDAHARFSQAYDALVRGLAQWPAQYSALFHDVDYGRAQQRGKTDCNGLSDADYLDHLRNVHSRWQSTNLCKLLRQMCTRTMAAAAV